MVVTRSSSRRSIECLAAVVFAALLALPSVGAAQSKADEEGTVRVFLERATKAYADGDYKQATALYHRLYMMAPDRPVSLYNAARLEEKMGQFDLAAAHYREFLTAAAKDDPKLPLAKARFEAVNAKLEAQRAKAEVAKVRGDAAAREAEGKHQAEAAPKPVAVGDGAVVGAQTARGWRQPVGWGAAVVGGLALVGGGVLLVKASGDKAALDDKLAASCAAYGDPYHDVSFEAAETRQGDIDFGNTLGVSALAGGVVLAGLGVWLLVSDGEGTVGFWPARGGGGVRLGWGF